MKQLNPSFVRLVGDIQNYAWGSKSLLPSLLGVEANGHPQAELWLGAHPSLPSRVDGVALDAAVAADPELFLGPRAANVANTLPFLMKVMAVASPLSIQVHPSKEQAEAGFLRENSRGLATDAPNRNYRDANHKPEIICALSDFSLLCGFVDDAETRRRLTIIRHAVGSNAALDSIADAFPTSSATADDRRALLGAILSMSSKDVPSVVQAVRTAGQERGLEHLVGICDHYPTDAGVLVAALMNFRVLRPGEAMFFEAGQTHAYLSGLGIELLANSDNVVRAGLTPKHIDIPELLQLCDPMPSAALIVNPVTRGTQTAWPVSCDDFSLKRYELSPSGAALSGHDGPKIVLCTSGRVVLEDPATGRLIDVFAGESAFVFPGVDIVVRLPSSDSEHSTVFVANSPYLSNQAHPLSG
jgi:mannose-6-phosphate isomerase